MILMPVLRLFLCGISPEQIRIIRNKIHKNFVIGIYIKYLELMHCILLADSVAVSKPLYTFTNSVSRVACANKICRVHTHYNYYWKCRNGVSTRLNTRLKKNTRKTWCKRSTVDFELASRAPLYSFVGVFSITGHRNASSENVQRLLE